MRGGLSHTYENLQGEDLSGPQGKKHGMHVPHASRSEMSTSSTHNPIVHPPPLALAPTRHQPTQQRLSSAQPSMTESSRSLTSEIESFPRRPRDPRPSSPRIAIPPPASKRPSAHRSNVSSPHSIASPHDYSRRPSGSPRPSPRHSTRDPEKGIHTPATPRRHSSPRSATHSSLHTTVFYTDFDDRDGGEEKNKHALWILTYLSALAPLLALATSLYSLIATFCILISFPVCRCITKTPLGRYFRNFLAPPLLLHLRLIYARDALNEEEEDADDDEDDEAAREARRNSRGGMLVLTNVLAPLYAVGIMLAAWVAAGFWFFGAILGDPNGKPDKEKNGAGGGREEDNDERTTVLYVSQWWERWLVKGLR